MGHAGVPRIPEHHDGRAEARKLVGLFRSTIGPDRRDADGAQEHAVAGDCEPVSHSGGSVGFAIA